MAKSTALKKFQLFLFLLLSKWGLTTHIIGGEIYYDRLGNGDYRITLEVYRDCFNGVALFDDPLQFTVFHPDGTIYSVFDFNINSITVLPYFPPDLCVIPPSDFCVELGIYSNIINLPDSPDGYIIAYSRCCWSGSILNIQTPENSGITITSFIPPTAITNSNPRFVNYPPLILCTNRQLDFDHAANDPDGDSLVYRIITPFNGGDNINPIPNPEPTPPFPLNGWETGFSETQPFGSNSIVQIDSQTGLLTFIPDLIGNFVLAVEVSEYRNGTPISTKSRTFGYRVVPCQIIPPITIDVIGTQDQLEDCSTALFVISRSDADSSLVVEINVSGTASNGIDYSLIPDSIVMSPGAFTDTINLVSLFDSISEGTETVDFQIIITNSCDPTDSDTSFVSLNILDYTPLEADYIDYQEICHEEWENYLYAVTISNGIAPYFFDWNNSTLPDNDTLLLPRSFFGPQENILTLTVTDQCNKSILLDSIVLNNQCPLTAPNIITANLDNINDAFLVRNLEDYDQVGLIVLNRWGNVVYEDTHYLNDWKGTDQQGKPLNDGVYFYIVTPQDDKYIYSEPEKLKYVLHGFLHIVRQ